MTIELDREDKLPVVSDSKTLSTAVLRIHGIKEELERANREVVNNALSLLDDTSISDRDRAIVWFCLGVPQNAQSASELKYNPEDIDQCVAYFEEQITNPEGIVIVEGRQILNTVDAVEYDTKAGNIGRVVNLVQNGQFVKGMNLGGIVHGFKCAQDITDAKNKKGAQHIPRLIMGREAVVAYIDAVVDGSFSVVPDVDEYMSEFLLTIALKGYENIMHSSPTIENYIKMSGERLVSILEDRLSNELIEYAKLGRPVKNEKDMARKTREDQKSKRKKAIDSYEARFQLLGYSTRFKEIIDEQNVAWNDQFYSLNH